MERHPDDFSVKYDVFKRQQLIIDVFLKPIFHFSFPCYIFAHGNKI